MVKSQKDAGSQQADLSPAPENATFSKENYELWSDYAVGCIRLVAASAQGEASSWVRLEIDRFKKVVDNELSFKGRGHFLTAIMEAFTHADLENSAAMLPLLRYLEQKYNMDES